MNRKTKSRKHVGGPREKSLGWKKERIKGTLGPHSNPVTPQRPRGGLGGKLGEGEKKWGGKGSGNE